jgi:hypothetical protein
MSTPNFSPVSCHLCEESVVEAFLAGAIRGKDLAREDFRDFLNQSGDTVFHINDLFEYLGPM